MSRPAIMKLAEIGEFYNTANLLRPINRSVVENYAVLLKQGTKLPPIELGEYQTEDKKGGKVIVDGAHIYRALHLAKIKEWPCHVSEYPNLAEALAEQLKQNISHGVRVSAQQRDSRIRQLIEVYNWSVREVAKAVGLHPGSVSRISRGLQNRTGTGKRGASTDKKRTAHMVPHAISPRAFVRTLENLQLTLRKPESRGASLLAIFDPKRSPQEVQRLVALLTEVASELSSLVNQQETPPTKARIRLIKRQAEVGLQAAA